MILVRNKKSGKILELIGCWEYSSRAKKTISKLPGAHEFGDMTRVRVMRTREDEVWRLSPQWEIYRR